MRFLSLYNKKGVFYLTEERIEFSDIYLAVRNKEKRVLTDYEVKKLPFVKFDNQNIEEWVVRQKSTKRFLKYFTAKNGALNVLDIGCGNGWFSNIIATTSNKHKVIGIDINKKELEQGARIFKNNNLQFFYGDIFHISSFTKQFDLITLNACVQYFPDFSLLFSKLKSFLKPQGEIHILDSPFYKKENIASAKQRSNMYYTRLGFPEMASRYFHHSYDDITDFKIMYSPKKHFLYKLLNKNDSPFYWLLYSNK